MQVCGWKLFTAPRLRHAKSISGSVAVLVLKCAGHTGLLPKAFTQKAHIHNSDFWRTSNAS